MSATVAVKLYVLLDTLNQSGAGRAQWSSVELSGALLIVSPEQVLPLLFSYNTQGWAEVTTVLVLSPVFSGKYETPLYHLVPHPGNCSGCQVWRVGLKLWCSTDDHRRAPVSPDEVHFQDDRPGSPRQAKQSVLGCIMGCTRELRVRATMDIIDIISYHRYDRVS